MKICFVLSDVSGCGGTERVCLNIASALAAYHTIHILSLNNSDESFFPHSNKVKIYHLLSNAECRLYSGHPKLLILKMKSFFLWHKYDIVIDTFLMNCNLTLPALKGFSTKHVVWSNFSYEYFRQVEHEQKALRKVKEAGSDLIVLTQGDLNEFITKENFNPSKIHQLYNQLTFEMTDYTVHSSRKILSVGRFASEKGFDMLIKSWKIVEQKIPDWTFEIWGDTGKDTGDVYSTFDVVKPERLTLHPATKNIREKYKEASIYVMSSRHEGFPLVLLESLAYSLPIISFDCPNGPREIVIDGYNGRLVEPNNIESLAEAMMELIKDDCLRTQMSNNSYIRSKEFCVEKIVQEWNRLIYKIVA